MDSKRLYDFVEENMKTIFAYALSRISVMYGRSQQILIKSF